MIAAADIVRLKVVLDDVEPAVIRRIEVPLGIRRGRLHAVLQAALGWTNSHLWEFPRPRCRLGHSRSWLE